MHKQLLRFFDESNLIDCIEDNLDNTIKAWDYLMYNNELSEEVILNTHFILMSDKLFPNQIGCFRKCNIDINGIKCLQHEKIKQKMDKWIERTNVNLKYPYENKDAHNISKNMHIAFERIHPFVGGNGVLGRMLMNWWRVKVGLSIFVILNERKSEYLNWFKSKEL